MADSLEQRIATLEARVAVLEGQNTPIAPTATAKKQSAKEFLLVNNPKTVVQKTLALAYYHEIASQNGAFNSDDLEAAFRAAKEKVPANINDMVNKNIKKGYLMEDADKKGDKKAWVLTATGERLVASNFKTEE